MPRTTTTNCREEAIMKKKHEHWLQGKDSGEKWTSDMNTDCKEVIHTNMEDATRQRTAKKILWRINKNEIWKLTATQALWRNKNTASKISSRKTKISKRREHGLRVRYYKQNERSDAQTDCKTKVRKNKSNDAWKRTAWLRLWRNIKQIYEDGLRERDSLETIKKIHG